MQVEVFEDVILANDEGKGFLGAIDQGTSSTRFLLFHSRQGRIAASAQIEHSQHYPPGHPGWHEHDPMELWNRTLECMKAVADAVETYTIEVKAIGITNQRETTLAWNKETGKPYYNAIVWDDLRTTSIAIDIGSQDCLRAKTGLPLASYFAGTKVKWLLDNVAELRHDVQHQPSQVCFGTVDTWLLYQLTGGLHHATDVSNASRWLFLDISTCQWDQELVDKVCAPHKLPLETLPQVFPSSHVFANISANVDSLYSNVPIAGILGDQQAALFGQTAFEAGQAKNTYGTGLFLMMNTGTKAVRSRHGLLTTVAYQIGNSPVHYALEGSVAHAGSTLQWLRDQLGMIESISESEKVAAQTDHNDGMYFVPAFSGLFAPYWRSDARACMVGMTSSHTRSHIVRAALEANAYQTKKVLDAITLDSQVALRSLKVDGGGTHNALLMQFQADMLNVPVVQPVVMETTALGAAFCAGLAVGCYTDLQEIQQLWAISKIYQPSMSPQERAKNWKGWEKAVTKSFGWDGDGEQEDCNSKL
jgi:glycerol kinase